MRDEYPYYGQTASRGECKPGRLARGEATLGFGGDTTPGRDAGRTPTVVSGPVAPAGSSPLPESRASSARLCARKEWRVISTAPPWQHTGDARIVGSQAGWYHGTRIDSTPPRARRSRRAFLSGRDDRPASSPGEERYLAASASASHTAPFHLTGDELALPCPRSDLGRERSV